MGWIEAIKAFMVALPELIKLWNAAAKASRERKRKKELDDFEDRFRDRDK